MSETTDVEPEYDDTAIHFPEALWATVGCRRADPPRLKGPLYDTVAAAVGATCVDKNIRTWEAMQKVLDSGGHRPTHLRGWKPGKVG